MAMYGIDFTHRMRYNKGMKLNYDKNQKTPHTLSRKVSASVLRQQPKILHVSENILNCL